MAEENKNALQRGVVVEFDFTAIDGSQLLFETAKKVLKGHGVDLTVKLEAMRLVGGNYQGGLSELFEFLGSKADAAKVAQELAEAVVASDLYTRMKQLEEEVAQDPEASGAMNNMIAKRKRVEEVLSTKNMKPDDLAQASLEMEAAETAMNSNEKIQALKAARKDFSDMMNNVNRILRLVITGEVEEDDFSATVSCGGNCANCSGCS